MEAEDIYLGSGLLFVSLLVFASRGVRTIVAAVLVLGWVTWTARLRGRDSTLRILQAIISVWCALAWVLNAGLISVKRRTLASVALLIHVATAITLAANDKPWGFVELALDVSAVVFVASHLEVNAPTWCGIEVVILLTAAARTHKDDVVQHLTWWSLLTLALFDATIAYDALNKFHTKLAPLFTPVLRVLTWTVAVGVITMSVIGCSLLQTALTDNYVIPYIVGNFAMHYYPALRATFAKSQERENGSRAVAFVAVYSLLHDAPDVYGCSYIAKETTPILLVSVAILVNASQFI